MNKLSLVLGFILLSSMLSLNAQIVFNGSVTKSGSGVSSLSFTKTVTAGNNVLLIVGVTVQDKNITSVTFSGTAMTQFTIGTRNSMRVALYYLPLGNLASNVTASVVVSIASSSDAFAGAADYSGVWQPAPFVNPTLAQAKSTTPSVTFTSAVGHKAISLLGDIAASPTANGSGQTQYWSFTGSHSNRACEKAGAASVTMSHTLSANEDWVMIGGTMQDYAVMTLPIELTEFKAKRINTKTVELNWQTASEKNNAWFSVEKSEDAVDWFEIAKVKGALNSTSSKSYTYYDDLTLSSHALYEEANTLYYRLSQVDVNGDKQTFDIVKAEPFVENLNDLVVYPNPATGDKINVHVDLLDAKGIGTVYIYTGAGKQVYKASVELNKGDNDIIVNSDFEKGVYVLKLYSGKELLSLKKLLIN